MKIVKNKIVVATLLIPVLINYSFKETIIKKASTTNKGFAVVELFTSEGCSSCPPADAVLTKLSAAYKQDVYFLGFHVDYWDRLGWKDSFSNAAYSERQYAYGNVMQINSVYTPQVIINGKTEMVGSDETRIRYSIQQELEKAPATHITIGAKNNNHTLAINYQLDKPTNDLLQIALVQLQANTHVQSGENKGRLLHHVNVVRSFASVYPGNTTSGNVSMHLPDNLSPEDCVIIAYTQHTNDLQITGATEVAIPAKSP